MENEELKNFMEFQKKLYNLCSEYGFELMMIEVARKEEGKKENES